MPEEIQNDRCYCDHCVFCGRVRGAIRRGDKKEMRAMLRDLLDRYEDAGEEITALRIMMSDLINPDPETAEEKGPTIQ